MTVLCNYCGKRTAYVDSRVIYGRSYGMVYYCARCHAWVGVHKGTDRPLGLLADAELRKWKQFAHAVFDPLWKHGGMTRNQAYAWLSKQLDLPLEETHIGMFDVERCKQVIKACNERSYQDE